MLFPGIQLFSPYVPTIIRVYLYRYNIRRTVGKKIILNIIFSNFEVSFPISTPKQRVHLVFYDTSNYTKQ